MMNFLTLMIQVNCQEEEKIIMNSCHKGKFNLGEKKPRRVIRKVEDLADKSGEIGKEIR